MVSGVSRLVASRSIRRPSAWPRIARRRRWSSVNCRRRPCKMLAQDPILLFQIVDHGELAPIDPAGEQQEQEFERAALHGATSVAPKHPALAPIARPPALQAAQIASVSLERVFRQHGVEPELIAVLEKIEQAQSPFAA